ncbi:30S ribosome-binding factor RbfA [Francisella frigiditurris]|uniref:Ribosome-binding factor A n=1 Tax=Francisella frigiditurris TaxID=1542390 RepID=A0A1J0KTL2_9GAMM|nr:30S ribosome-binding factor RbfA [Francisella frigiditurris]APC97027.1 ribosome-binding factor A [Francisella frigiditurris]
MAAEGRVLRVSSELKKTISLLLRSKVKDAKLSLVSITEVEMSKDLSFAKVYYSCLIEEDIPYVAEAFKKSKGFFRSSIAKDLKLRIVPELKFIYDDSIEYGMKMEGKIHEALEQDAKFIKHDKEEVSEDESHQKENKVEKLR